VADFLAWCQDHGVPSITAVQPLHVAVWIEGQTQTHAAPTVKQHLAALRHLFDWLVTGQIIPVNPAASVRGPSHVVRQGKTPVLEPAEARALIDSIDVSTHSGLRDRALIAMMVYSFARVGAALGRGTAQLTRTPLPQANAYEMIRRRALAAGIGTKVGNHSFRATGITAYLKNGGTLEKAAQMANHASTRTTQLYDRRRDEMSLDEVERIRV
jgi:site-specific recombinase XerD